MVFLCSDLLDVDHLVELFSVLIHGELDIVTQSGKDYVSLGGEVLWVMEPTHVLVGQSLLSCGPISWFQRQERFQ